MSQRPLGPQEQQILTEQKARVDDAQERLQEEVQSLRRMVALVAGVDGQVDLDRGVVIQPEEGVEELDTETGVAAETAAESGDGTGGGV